MTSLSKFVKVGHPLVLSTQTISLRLWETFCYVRYSIRMLKNSSSGGVLEIFANDAIRLIILLLGYFELFSSNIGFIICVLFFVHLNMLLKLL